MKKANSMNTIFVKAVLFNLLIAQGVMASDIKQIRARNEVAEQGLMNLRIEQAKAILAGTDPQASWRNKVVQLNNLVTDINIYANGQTNNNYSLAIDAGQSLIKELSRKYTKKVYGKKRVDNTQADPLLENFISSFRILKRMEKHPENHVELYAKLQLQMTELDELIQNR